MNFPRQKKKPTGLDADWAREETRFHAAMDQYLASVKNLSPDPGALLRIRQALIGLAVVGEVSRLSILKGNSDGQG